MTATDELRRLLDGRGVEWKAWDGTHPITVWHDETYSYEFVEYRLVNGAKQVSNCPSDNDGHCELTVKVFNLTPAQAVEATLGVGTCRDVGKAAVFKCSECGWYSPVFTFGEEMPCYCPSCGRKVVDA